MNERRQKQIFLTGAAVLAIISLLAGWYFTLRKGFFLGDDFYYKTGNSIYRHDRSNYIEHTSDNSFKIVSDAGVKTASVHTSSDSVTIDFSEGEPVAGNWNGKYLADSNGLALGWDQIMIYAGYSDGTNTKPPVSNLSYSHALCRIYFGSYETISMWYVPILGIVIYMLGIIVLLYPEESYFLLTKWQYEYPRLSEAGMRCQRISGVIVCILAISIMSGVIFLFL